MSVDLTDLFATFSSVESHAFHTHRARVLFHGWPSEMRAQASITMTAPNAPTNIYGGGSIIGHTLFSDEQCAPVGTSWFFFLWGEMRRSHLQ